MLLTQLSISLSLPSTAGQSTITDYFRRPNTRFHNHFAVINCRSLCCILNHHHHSFFEQDIPFEGVL
ncbi:hypothetical protein L1987_79539 [Smallanthus sonchifolius]|uniref:Uncharacterized protein n=1 Tax=Smallanthus sonchifolius TaxID=185202 RepID=A0ACB8ZGR9_9ASTR|nr:hypothetical protein L1987_79539 [Smallanthus sonchifolius]